MVTDYTIVSHSTHYGLSERIKEMLKQGWIVQGGLAIDTSPISNSVTYRQAMVK